MGSRAMALREDFSLGAFTLNVLRNARASDVAARSAE
jgi:hypothetical protein